MPEISRFFGIVIRMYWSEKEHKFPHFHAYYGKYEASFSIEPLEVIIGKLPPRIYGFVMEWAVQHRKELMENWNRLKKEEEVKKIKPLV